MQKTTSYSFVEVQQISKSYCIKFKYFKTFHYLCKHYFNTKFNCYNLKKKK